MIDSVNFVKVFEAPDQGEITTTWCAELKSDNGEYNYNCYAAWEMTDKRFIDSVYFFDMIQKYADELTNLP